MGEQKRVRLTKRTVDAATPAKGRYLIMDDEISGFGLRVEPSGSKTYFVRYRANGGGRRAPQRVATVGRHGPVTPEQARREARRLLGAVASGDDPAGERGAARREMTVAELVDLYAEDGCFVQRGVRQGQPMKATTRAYTLARLRHHVVPLLGKRRISDIGPGDIEKFVKDVADGKTAREQRIPGSDHTRAKRVVARGGAGAARKVVRDFSAVLSFAIRRGLVTTNPVSSAAVRKTDNKRERFLSLTEITSLRAALIDLETEGMNPKAANIVRLWMLTGCRRDEISGLKWFEVDLDGGLLRLDDTKTGKSVRPLGIAAQTILTGLSRHPNSPFVFPAESGNGYFGGTSSLWPKITLRAKLGPDVTPHVLRHTVGSLAASGGASLPIVGAILGHANPRSTAGYAHISKDPAQLAANIVGNTIAAALGGNACADQIETK